MATSAHAHAFPSPHAGEHGHERAGAPARLEIQTPPTPRADEATRPPGGVKPRYRPRAAGDPPYVNAFCSRTPLLTHLLLERPR